MYGVLLIKRLGINTGFRAEDEVPLPRPSKNIRPETLGTILGVII